MKEKLTGFGALLSSFFAAICWLGPLILVPLGLGGLSSVLASSLGRYRITFTVLAMALLLFSHFLHLRQKNRSKVNTVILWISTAAVIFILIYF